MKRFLFSLLIITIISAGSIYSQNPDLKGTWEITYNHNEAHLKLRQGDKEDQWNFGGTFDLKRLTGYREGRNVSFSLKNDAGEIRFSGNVNAEAGSGTFEFYKNSSYVNGMKQLGYDGFEGKEYLVFTMKDFKLSDLEEFQKLGFKDIPEEKVVALAALGVTPVYAKEIMAAGFAGIDINRLISFRALNVDAKRITELKATFGDDLSETDVMSFTAMKVDAEYAAQMKNAGFDLTPKQLVAYKAMKVTPEYLAELKAAGLGDASYENILGLKAQGVDAAFIKECRQMGIKDLTASTVIKLKVFKLDNEYISMIRNAGYKDATIEQILQFRIMKIDAEFIEKAKDFNDGQLPDPDKLVGLKVMRNKPEQLK